MSERDLFIAALRMTDPAERSAWLDRECGADAALRQRIEVLLRAFVQAGSLLENPALAPQANTGKTGHGGLPPSAVVGSEALPEEIGTEQPGVVLAGRYKLVEEIGAGGMGTVWLAQQTAPVRRLVAVKLIKAGMDSKQVIARFEAERQALALMDHPHIAKVHDGGVTQEGRPFFVMELVKGTPITCYCDEHKLTPRQRLELFVPVCAAIQHAHQKGVIHRDLKPSNVLVAPYDGEPVVKVIDFGVAKAAGQQLTDRTLVTGFGAIVGTLEYMSPEQAELNNQDIDTRSDIYSLGVLLYELLTGSPPFSRMDLEQAGLIEMLRLIREQEPTRPSTKLGTADGLPVLAANRGTEPRRLTALVKGELDWIVMKTLEKERNRRYETASAFAADVQRYLNDEPVLACPPSVGYRLRKFARRYKGPLLAVSLVVLVLVGGIIGTTWGMAGAVNEAKQKETALTAAQKSERDAKDKLWLSLYERARAGRFSRQMGQRLESLAALAQAAGIRSDERLRDEAIAAMALPDVRRVPGWRSSPPGTTTVAYGGQYRLYARADIQGTISIRSIPDDQEIRRIAAGAIIANYLYFSPDERFLLGFGPGNTLRVWRVADGQLAIRDESRGWRAHAFSPDGRRLAVSQHEWVHCFNLATGQEVKRWRLPAQAHGLAFHPDNGKLAVGYFSSSVVSVFDAASGALLTDLPVGAMAEQVVAWHPDGERLALTGSDPRIQIWNVAAKRKVATLEGHAQFVPVLTFHPDGSLLASHSWDGDLRLWDPSTGRPLLQLPFAVGDRPRFSGDGRWLGAALHGEQADLLEVTLNPEYRTLASSAGAGGGGYGHGDISPDGRLLAVGMDPGTRLWDLRRGRELAALPAWTNFVFFDGGAGGKEGPLTPNSPRWSLLTSGSGGLLRWPVTSDDPDGERLRLGPPRQLSSLSRAWFARSRDGRTLGVVTEEGGANKILDLETGTVRRDLGIHPKGGEVRALSGDGRWAASSGWHSDRVRLWDARTGQIAREWVLGKRTYVFFTPDSRTLIISRGDEFSFWDLATLQPIRRLPRDVALFPGYVAFSRDGKLMAMEMAPAVIHLKEVSTGRTVAKLEDPHGDRASWQGFTPDGTQLVVVANYASAIHIWDLRAIRARLKDMNLDWDWPEFPPAATQTRAAEPVTIEVLADALTREQKAQQAIERFRRAVEADPDSAQACNSLAWVYLTAPEGLRDVKAALPLAENAVRLASGDLNYRNTLGVAYYRAGRFRQAVTVLRPNLDRQGDRVLAIDLYFLAMSHHRLGETERARDYYDWALRWVRAQPGLSAARLDELTAFRAEAEELLGIEQKKD